MRKTQQWPELVQVIDHHANVEDDPPKRVELLLDLAQLYESQIGDPGRAIAAYRRALALVHDDAERRSIRWRRSWGAAWWPPPWGCPSGSGTRATAASESPSFLC